MPQPVSSGSFSQLAATFDSEHWRVLGLIAAERKVTASALDRLGLSAHARNWLRDALEHGLLVDGGVVYALPYTRGFEGERTLTVSPEVRTLVLRHAVGTGKLDELCADAKALYSEHSVANFAVALYAGDFRALVVRSAELSRRTIESEGLAWQRRRLYEAICCPLDPQWLFARWGEWGWQLVEQVLADALVSFEPIDELYRFCLSSKEEFKRAQLYRLLADAAWLKGDSVALDAWTARLPQDEQAPYLVIASLLAGQPARAMDLLLTLVKQRGAKKNAATWSVGAVVVLSLVTLAAAPAEGAARARTLVQRLATPPRPAIEGWPTVAESVAVARALRALLRRMTEPDGERLRPSPHHQPSDAPGWETLLLALTVEVEGEGNIGALAWATRLLKDAERWSQAGYTWLSRQALLLAQTLSPEGHPDLLQLPPVGPKEFALARLLVREPEWRRALRVLEQYADSSERSDLKVSCRVAWFLDMSCGELSKPALEEYRVGSGWTRGRRVDFEELRACRDELPAEDLGVLVALDSAPKTARVPLEAVEALCGHPRVFDGARGKQRVEVARGQCRLLTREERGELVIEFEPAGARLGLHIVVESETRVVVYRLDAALAKLQSLLPSGLRIPLSQKREGLSVLARLADRVPVDSPELGAYRTIAADSTPCIRLSPESGAFWVELGVRPFGELGRFFPPGLGRSQVSVHSGEELFDSERHLDEEVARFREFVDQCPTLKAALSEEAADELVIGRNPYSASLGEEELFGFLAELRQVTLTYNLEWKNGRAITCRGKLTVKGLQGSLKRVKGWYLVNGQVNLDDVSPLSLGQLVRMPFTKSGRFVRLPTGDILEVERRVSQVLSSLARVGQMASPGGSRGGNSELRIPESAFEVLRTLSAPDSEFSVDPDLERWLGHVEDTLSAVPTLPEGLMATLRPYQLEGYAWLWRYSQLKLGACLADDMGLGKTVQVITLLLGMRQRGATLVIAPTSVCTNWIVELNRFAPSLTAAEYTGKSRAAWLTQLKDDSRAHSVDVLVASYATLQQDAEELGAIEWNTVVLDEAQFIKNPNSLRAKAAFGLKACHRIALTGTPIENHLGDLWSIFHFLQPALLGSFKHFQLSYLKPIERDRDFEQQALLKKLVLPFILRRRKDEVLRDLPPITTLCHEVRLTEDEHLRYGLLRRQIHDKLRTTYGKREHKLQVLAEITRLRRFCCHPRLVFPDAPLESAKLQAFLELAEELRDNGHRALVFSQFVDFLEIVRQQLDERGFRYVYLDGSTPKEVRHARVNSFQSGDMELFLISLKAGGFGLNLTAADYVIHLDPWWNPAVEAQATDRAHRIGQERPVTVYRLVTKASIEERIVELHREKRAIADALLDDAGASAALSQEQLMDLLA